MARTRVYIPQGVIENAQVVRLFNEIADQLEESVVVGAVTFDDLTDVAITAPVGGQAIVYDGGTNTFVNRALTFAELGATPTSLAGYGIALAAASANASTSSVAVAAANATDLASNNTLTNELKTDVNQLVTDLNAAIASLNDLKAKLRAAGILET